MHHVTLHSCIRVGLKQDAQNLSIVLASGQEECSHVLHQQAPPEIYTLCVGNNTAVASSIVGHILRSTWESYNLPCTYLESKLTSSVML